MVQGKLGSLFFSASGVLAFVGSLPGCVGEDPRLAASSGGRGDIAQQCLPDGMCHTGLTCFAGVCVEHTDAGVPASEAGTNPPAKDDGGDSDASTCPGECSPGLIDYDTTGCSAMTAKSRVCGTNCL